MEDEQIIELYHLRNEQAITETDVKYGGKSRSLAYNILNNREDSEECTNDSYLVLWNRIPPEIPRSLCAYLLKVVRNLSLKLYEKNTAKKRNSYYDIALDELEAVISIKDNPEEEALANELGGLINEYLDRLPKESRILFVHRYWFGTPINEIALLNGMTEHNVTVKLGRIRKGLQTYLRERGYCNET